ncbi:MAG: c-type cytochrome [Sphingomonadales bacterium]|nr:c-type cytochrome [Sphingomonadales bacterium]MDE2569799.1 c-type cytochrome [Sphingomonadales bacterium]
MKTHTRILAVTALSLSLAACGGSKDEAASNNEAAAPVAAGNSTATEAASEAAPAAAGAATSEAAAPAAGAAPMAFAICKTCHSPEKGKNMIGPSLFAVYGTKAGEVAGYNFSDAMKKSGLTWDDATLDTYLTNPMKMVPGTKMTYAGQPDAAKRKEIIEYLKSLK